MIWRLLRKNISIRQISGYAISTFVGLGIIITALKFYGDVGNALRGKDKGAVNTSEYMVVSLPVSVFDTFGFGSTSQGITAAEIDKMLKQPWAEDIGAFTPCNFNATGGVTLGDQSIWSYMFMEAVPDRFLDSPPSDFAFDTSHPFDNEIPIIVSREYLALYNFGFAPSRGMPQLSETLIPTISADMYLNGNGLSDMFKARIVGFSDRINSILVPESFLTWANKRYAPNITTNPQRIIVEVNNPGDPAIKKYISKHGFVLDNETLEHGKAMFLLRIVVSVVVAIGIVICALSLFILMLSITLLLQKNKEKNAALLLLGYSPSQVSACYYKLVGIVNASVAVLATAAMLFASSIWQKQLESLGMATSSPAIPIAVGLGIIAIITAVNFYSIRRSIIKAF